MLNIPITTTEEYMDLLLSKGKCPKCEAPLKTIGQVDKDGDGDATGYFCDNCGYRIDF